MTTRQVALTGATGFIGSRLLERLVVAGFGVRALTRKAQPKRDGVEWIDGDLGDETALALLVADTDLAIHLAGAVRGVTRADFDAVNVAGARNFARAADYAGVARVLAVSTLAAREPSLSHYAASKREGEAVLRQFCDDATVLRPPAVYGPGDRELMPLLNQMRHGFAPLPHHRGRFSVIHVDDLVAAIVAWMESDVRGGTYELHDGKEDGYDWRTLRRTVAEVCGRRSVPIPLPRALLATAAMANVTLARLFGYAPMMTPGKVRELFHADWVVRESDFETDCGWRPALGLAAGLACTFT